MKLLIFEHPKDVTEKECVQDIDLLPEWRRAQALSYRFLIDRVLCAKAYLLLKQGLSEMYGITENVDFDYVGDHKPILRHYPDIHFNLSHCKQGVLCAINDKPIGCDIEELQERLDPAVCRHSCSDSEMEHILSAADPCMEFTRLWTMKEAFLKMQGKGISESLPELFSRELSSELYLHSWVNTDCNFVYSICT